MGRIPQKSSFVQQPNGTVIINLTHDQITVIDSVDTDLVSHKWFASFAKTYADGGSYIVRRNTVRSDGKRVTIAIHQIIMQRMIGRDIVTGEMVDHIDHNPLNNCRSNLRLVNRAENGQNRKGKNRNNTSGFKGVTFHKDSGRWIAQKHVNGKHIHIGLFATAEEAHEAYCKSHVERPGNSKE